VGRLSVRVCVCVWGGRAGPVKPFVSSSSSLSAAAVVWWDAIAGRVVSVIRGSADVMNNPRAWHRHKGRSETTHTHSLARFRNTFHPADSPPYRRVYLITPSPLVLTVGDLWLCSSISPHTSSNHHALAYTCVVVSGWFRFPITVWGKVSIKNIFFFFIQVHIFLALVDHSHLIIIIIIVNAYMLKTCSKICP